MGLRRAERAGAVRRGKRVPGRVPLGRNRPARSRRRIVRTRPDHARTDSVARSFAIAPGDLVRPTWNAPGENRFVLLQGGVLGRADDMMIVRGVNIFPSSVEQIIHGFPEIVEYRMMAHKRGAMDELTIEIEDRLEAPQRVAEELQLAAGAARGGPRPCRWEACPAMKAKANDLWIRDDRTQMFSEQPWDRQSLPVVSADRLVPSRSGLTAGDGKISWGTANSLPPRTGPWRRKSWYITGFLPTPGNRELQCGVPHVSPKSDVIVTVYDTSMGKDRRMRRLLFAPCILLLAVAQYAVAADTARPWTCAAACRTTCIWSSMASTIPSGTTSASTTKKSGRPSKRRRSSTAWSRS